MKRIFDFVKDEYKRKLGAVGERSISHIPPAPDLPIFHVSERFHYFAINPFISLECIGGDTWASFFTREVSEIMKPYDVIPVPFFSFQDFPHPKGKCLSTDTLYVQTQLSPFIYESLKEAETPDPDKLKVERDLLRHLSYSFAQTFLIVDLPELVGTKRINKGVPFTLYVNLGIDSRIILTPNIHSGKISWITDYIFTHPLFPDRYPIYFDSPYSNP